MTEETQQPLHPAHCSSPLTVRLCGHGSSRPLAHGSVSSSQVLCQTPGLGWAEPASLSRSRLTFRTLASLGAPRCCDLYPHYCKSLCHISVETPQHVGTKLHGR